MEVIMKRTLWDITLTSIITLVAYIALYAIWGAILSGVENPTLKLFFVTLMTTVAFGCILVYICKIKKSIGEDEVMNDYKDKKYVSFVDDFKLIFKRENQILVCIAIIALICFVLNTFDSLVFEKKMISFPTFFFLPLYMFGSLTKVSFLGYALSVIFEFAVYIVFLLVYRKRKYDYWMGKKE